MGRLPSWRAGCGLAAAWALMAVGLTAMTLVSLATLRVGVDRWFPPLARALARGALAAMGVHVVVRSGAERLAGRRARICVINHSSQLDILVIGSLLPDGVTVVAKKEMLFVPFIGLGFVAFKFVLIDRARRDRAQRSLEEAGQRIRDRAATVVIAPEGTRSRTGDLGPFKMGAFHLALHTQAPVVPVVLRGCAALQPMGAVAPRPGTVTVDVLEEIPTDGWSEDDLKVRRDHLHALYVGELSG